MLILLSILVAVIIVINKNNLWSLLLLALISLLISLGWLIKGLSFIGIILTIVYAGAIIILIVFVLYILDINKLDIIETKQNKMKILWLVLLIVLLYSSEWNNIIVINEILLKTDIEVLAINSYSNNVLLLVITSILLLLSLTGPIILLTKSINLMVKYIFAKNKTLVRFQDWFNK